MTGLEVSPIAFGAWELGGEWGAVDQDRGIAAVRHSRRLGVNLFDTAQGYGFGASERLLGAALRDDLDHRRDRREIEAELLPYCREHDIGVLVYGPLAHGLLTEALDEDTTFAPDDWRSGAPFFGARTIAATSRPSARSSASRPRSWESR
jgi:aryl-alcohol dehydrogenase-like predicted oxidoreductase